MKKEILSFLVLFSILSVSAQTYEDALLFSENELVGTARSAGMSNAFGALGADLSTLSSNPAGLGVYQSYEFAFSLNLGGVDMASYYLDNKITNSSGNFNVPSFGLVAPIKSNPSSDLKVFMQRHLCRAELIGKNIYLLVFKNESFSLNYGRRKKWKTGEDSGWLKL